MDYKTTLNLPQTSFPMKAGLPVSEPLCLADWEKKGIYQNIRQNSSGSRKYILHDGPPYANGDIHIGHALNKILKDIIIKFKTMNGFDSPYVPGWDCHGLPIEHQLLKELKINKSQIAQVDFRKKAHAYAMKYVEIQKEQFKRLGVFGDWNNPYLTLSPEYEESIVTAFAELVKKGYIYRGLKPVNWCYKCETALAEAEVEYQNHNSPSIYVKFALEDTEAFGRQVYLLIWTTTPWTLIANVAVALHPEFTYVKVKTNRGTLIIAKDLLEAVLSQAGIGEFEITGEYSGKELEGLIYTHPFGLRKGKVVLADYVSRQEGTGLVHTAPGHGSEDYLTGLKYGLEIIMPVDARGKFDDSAGEYKGLAVYDANKNIIDKLITIGALLFEGKIQHSYPHCWRCKQPVIFRATKQWFLKLDYKEDDFAVSLRDKLRTIIKEQVKWIPETGRERILAMVEARPDWCLSRQRYWGVPIPALACNQCHEEFLEIKVIEKFADFVSKESSDSWFERNLEDFLPSGIKCPYCQNSSFSKGRDILDVWFDSGVSHQAVLKKRKELGSSPADLYLEGSDQHRGWFQSSLIPSVCLDNKPPFRNVLTHGFVVDGEGRKMSKSLGNVISPFSIIKDYGADILRLWVAASDYNEDIRISSVILSRLSEAYRKIRNTARFILSNLYDFDPEKDKVNYSHLRKIDKWILYKAQGVLSSVSQSYENFEFHKAYKGIYEFCNETLSMYYLDMVKGRLYTYAPGWQGRRAAQTALYEVLHLVTRIMAPIMAFTADEIWHHLPKDKKDISVSSVHFLNWPEYNASFAQEDKSAGLNMGEELKVSIDLVPDITKALEAKRIAGIIGSSFDAKINLLTKEQNRYTYLKDLAVELSEIFKVSKVDVLIRNSFEAGLTISSIYPDIAIEVSKAEGTKCERCWNYSLTVGTDREQGAICNRCIAAVKGDKIEKEI